VPKERTDHGSVGDETDEGVGRQQAQADDDSVLERLEVIIVEASVDDVEEDGRDLRRTSERVLDGGVLGEELGGEIVGGDVLVVRREGVALQAEGADPQLASDVDLAVGVEDTTARLARYGLVQHWWKIRAFLERRVELCEGL